MRKSYFKLPYLVIYCLILLIACLTPMHSDDFHFYSLGLSFDNHLNQYMTFCGRFFIDYFSSFILLLNNHFLVAIINSLAVPLLLYNLVTMNYSTSCEPDNKCSWSMAIILLVTYWLGNPALGETTFWLVGASNYLWPLVVFSFFIKFALKTFFKKSITKKDYGLLLPLAFLSAVNEANGLLALFMLIVFIFIAYYKRLPNKSLLICCFIASLLSYLILIAAPGNFLRAGSEEFAWWYNMSFEERINFYLYTVLPNLLKKYLVVFIIISWAVWQAKDYLRLSAKYLISLFVGLFVLFGLSLFVSPGSLTPRSYLTGLFCLLAILAILLSAIFSRSRAFSFVNKMLLITLMGYFVVSYILVFMAYLSIYQQDCYRVSLINQQKQLGKKVITIPRYHYAFVLNEGDWPSSFHNSIKMGEYYGVKEIDQYLLDNDFDYGSLTSATCHTVSHNPYIKCVYLEKSLFENNTKFIFEFNQEVAGIDNYKTAFFTKIVTLGNKDDEGYYISVPLVIRPLGNRLFAVVNTVTSLITADSKSVNIEILKSTKDKNINADNLKLLDIPISL